MNKKRILVVNDDGYDAIGIQILARHLTKYGDVVVYAPAEHQSAQSQAITCFQPINREEVFGMGYKCYKVFGKEITRTEKVFCGFVLTRKTYH